MSAFWSTWIIVLAIVTLGIATFLFVWALRVRIPHGADGTTGHVWAHGVLREAVRPLPAWWVVISVLVFASGFAYLYAYPGLGSYAGSLAWTSQTELTQHAEANRALLAPLAQRVGQGTVEQIAADPAARPQGRRLFADHCAPCHGGTAQGNPLIGAPSLVDDDWLYGGDGAAILTSVLDGRRGVMPPFTPAFNAAGATDVAHYVRSLSGAQHDAAKAKRGSASYGVCVACHSADGSGNIALGAPDLTDDVWVYGGDLQTIARTITHGRSGVMPALRGKLSEPEAKLVAAWVYGRSREPDDAN